MPDLLPCPFCGCNDMMEVGPDDYGYRMVKCEYCGVEVSGCKTDFDATEKWNERPAPWSFNERYNKEKA